MQTVKIPTSTMEMQTDQNSKLETAIQCEAIRPINVSNMGNEVASNTDPPCSRHVQTLHVASKNKKSGTLISGTHTQTEPDLRDDIIQQLSDDIDTLTYSQTYDVDYVNDLEERIEALSYNYQVLKNVLTGIT